VNQLQSWYYRQPPALRTILVINVAFYVVAQFLNAFWGAGYAFLRTHLALQPTYPDFLFEPWQLVTYNFMHLSGGLPGLLHIAFNMLWLFWIGKEYEEMHGSERMWKLYLFSGVAGGLMCILLSPVLPGIAGGTVGGVDIPVEGASASVLGVAMAVAILYPYKQIGLLFIGVVRLLYVVLGFLVIDALLALTSTGVAVAAHWGGALGGFLFAKSERGALPFSLPGWLGGGGSRRSRASSSQSASPSLLDRLEAWLGGSPDGSPTPPSSPSSDASSSSSKAAPTQANDLEKEVDRILEKISAEGYDALSDEEKRTLQEASQS